MVLLPNNRMDETLAPECLPNHQQRTQAPNVDVMWGVVDQIDF